MNIRDIKSKVIKQNDGNNYINVSIEEMDWCVNQVEILEWMLDRLVYEGLDGEAKLTSKEYIMLLIENDTLKKENQRLLNSSDVEKDNKIKELESIIGKYLEINKKHNEVSMLAKQTI